MSHLAETILSAARALPEGGLLSPKEFLHLASRAAIDQTLARLTRDGKLLRIARGAYALPVASRFGDRPPSTTAVVEGIESAKRTVELKHGSQWQLVLGKRPAGRAIRALSWLGPEQAPAALKILHAKLPSAEWAALRSARATLPSWMARAVSEASESA